MSDKINVKKRNGRGTEPLDIEKIHQMVAYACEGLSGVSESQVEIQSGLQFYDGVTTEEIQLILINSANNLISNLKYVIDNNKNAIFDFSTGNLTETDDKFTQKRNEDDFSETLALINKYKAVEESLKRAEYFVNVSRDALSIFEESEEKKILQNLSDFSLDRKY